MNQMQGMLQDYLSVKDEAKEFNAFVDGSPNSELMPESNFEFSIQCLKTSNWPNFKAFPLTMPAHIDDKFQQFTRFYSNKHQRRKVNL